MQAALQTLKEKSQNTKTGATVYGHWSTVFFYCVYKFNCTLHAGIRVLKNTTSNLTTWIIFTIVGVIFNWVTYFIMKGIYYFYSFNIKSHISNH